MDGDDADDWMGPSFIFEAGDLTPDHSDPIQWDDLPPAQNSGDGA